LRTYRVTLGCDPEFFITGTNDKVLAADKFLPHKSSGFPIYFDGIQAEINPSPSTCRDSLRHNIWYCLCGVRNKISETGNDARMTVKASAPIEQEVIDKAHEDAKVFGCAPSRDCYKNGTAGSVTIDASKHLKRYCGGHIHLGRGGRFPVFWFHNNQIELVRLLDILVGNTCVLIDHGEEGRIRREHYGRAGEYRLPKHGLEYRVLSNFWLQHPIFMYLVMGLARGAVNIFYQDEFTVQRIFELVTERDVCEAINENRPDLAWFNYKKIEPLLFNTFTHCEYYAFPLRQANRKVWYYMIAETFGAVPEPSLWGRQIKEQNLLQRWARGFGLESYRRNLNRSTYSLISEYKWFRKWNWQSTMKKIFGLV